MSWMDKIKSQTHLFVYFYYNNNVLNNKNLHQSNYIFIFLFIFISDKAKFIQFPQAVITASGFPSADCPGLRHRPKNNGKRTKRT